jgi:hypothetical protein
MTGSLHPLVTDWLKAELMGSTLILITALLLFGYYLRADWRDSTRFGPWLGNILGAAGKTLLFVGLNVLVYALLSTQYQNFVSVYGGIARAGSPVNRDWNATATTWTPGLRQNELSVLQYVDSVQIMEIPPADPAGKTLYQNIAVSDEVPQNSIVSFHGLVDVGLNDAGDYERGEGGFNTYVADVRFEYGVVNSSAQPTRAVFEYSFPTRGSWENIHILFDGRDITFETRETGYSTVWERMLEPGKVYQVVVSYRFRGMDGFLYVVPFREVRDFDLAFRANTSEIGIVVDPPGDYCTVTNGSGDKHVVSLHIDRAVLAPALGFYFIQKAIPYSPFDPLINYIKYIPRSILMLSCILILTLLVCGQKVDGRYYGVAAFLQAAQMLVLMGIGPTLGGFQVLAMLAALGTVVAMFFVLRPLDRLPRFLILGWMAFFVFYYPFNSVTSELAKRNAFESIVLVALIAYTFSLTLFIRIRNMRRESITP